MPSSVVLGRLPTSGVLVDMPIEDGEIFASTVMISLMSERGSEKDVLSDVTTGSWSRECQCPELGLAMTQVSLEPIHRTLARKRQSRKASRIARIASY